MASSAATSLGFLLLTGNTIAAIRRSRADDDAAATAFVVTSYASLVLLFYCLWRFETSPTAGSAARERRARVVGVWLTTTLLLTAMLAAYASGVGLAPPVVVGGGALAFLICLSEFDRAQIGGLGGQYAELLKMGVAAVACNYAHALARHHHARGDAGSLQALVFFAYSGFVTFTWFFLRRFSTAARARRAEQ